MLKATSTITEMEAYHAGIGGEDIAMMDIALIIGRSDVTESRDFALYQNEPNPFTDQTVIGFDLPEAMSAQLTIYDVLGRTVYVVNGDYAEGYNEIVIRHKELFSAPGAYYYRLDAGDFTASKKMILTE